MPTRIATHDAIDVLFHPRAVAVIGASDDATKHGYIVLNNIRDTRVQRRRLRHQAGGCARSTAFPASPISCRSRNQ